jgi:hypothetical protein
MPASIQCGHDSRTWEVRDVLCGGAIIVRAVDAWRIARFCALVAEEADDDVMLRSLISIRDVWIDIANECELLAGRIVIAQREVA